MESFILIKEITLITWIKKKKDISWKLPIPIKPSSYIRKNWIGCAASPKHVPRNPNPRIEDFHEIKHRASQRRQDHKVQLELNMERLGSKIVEIHNISKELGGKQLMEHFSYTFQKGERLGIIGKNGTGKSTFLNMLTGNLDPDTGKIVIGETVKFGYYTQKGIKIKPGQKVVEVIKEFGDYIPLKKGRQISAEQLLERFLFSRKKQYDFVEKLSGGEKKRLYLCTVLIQNPNFLILDEPTNDLGCINPKCAGELFTRFSGLHYSCVSRPLLYGQDHRSPFHF